jgi:N-acetylglutamate synthase-like GNAT family acetyltransferase
LSAEINESNAAIADAAFLFDQIVIREATASDADAINFLYFSLTANKSVNVKAERITAIAQHDDHFLFVAEIGDKVCGTVFMSFCMDAMFGEQPFTVVENIIVASDSRQRGVDAKLLAHVEAISTLRGSSKIMLLSSTERETAHVFFQRAGFSSGKKRAFVKYRSQFTR